MGDDYNYEDDRPDDHDLIKDRRVPADRQGTRAYTHWREILRTPHPAFGPVKSVYPLSHPWWPEKGHPLNTDRHYDDHVAMFGEIPGYEPSSARGYVPKRKW